MNGTAAGGLAVAVGLVVGAEEGARSQVSSITFGMLAVVQGNFGNLQAASFDVGVTFAGKGTAKHLGRSCRYQGKLLAGKLAGLGTLLMLTGVLICAPKMFAMMNLFVDLLAVGCGTDVQRATRVCAQLTFGLHCGGNQTDIFSGLQVTPSTVDKPFSKDVNAQSVQLFSPTGMPLWFTHLEKAWGDRGFLDLNNWKRLGEYSKKLNAIVVTPLIVVNFVTMQSSGNQSGLMARTAKADAVPGMNVRFFSSIYNSPSDEGGVQMTKGVDSEINFGSMNEVAADDNKVVKGIFDVLGKAAGLANAGGANNASSTRVMQTTNADYRNAAQDVLGKATGTFAKLFQKYPAP